MRLPAYLAAERAEREARRRPRVPEPRAPEPFVPACMSPDDLAGWQAQNVTAHRMGARLETRPCVDCPAWYSEEMGAVGRCNGTPGQD